MKPEYQQAIRTGLACGVALAVVYLIFSAASLWVSSTPAMKAYTEQTLEPFKDMWKDWPYRMQPVTYPANMPQPPFEYYVSTTISMATFGVIIIGLLLIGAYVIKKRSEAKLGARDLAYTGGIAGAAAYLPVLLAMIVLSFVSTIWGSQMTMVAGIMPPGFAAAIPYLAVTGVCCCCLPAGIVASVIVSAIGALGYALLTNRL